MTKTHKVAARPTTKKSAKTAPAPKPRTAPTAPVMTGKTPTVCWCGCGNHTKSHKSRFVPGHDASLKSRSLAVARNQIETHVDELSDALPHDDARDWFHARVEAERKVLAAKAKVEKSNMDKAAKK